MKALSITITLYTECLLCTSTTGNASAMQTCFIPTTGTVLKKTIVLVRSTEYERELNKILGYIWTDFSPYVTLVADLM